jgi:hypothetical protein
MTTIRDLSALIPQVRERAERLLAAEDWRRFWAKVGIREDDCWPWLASKNDRGYGKFYLRRELRAQDGGHRREQGRIWRERNREHYNALVREYRARKKAEAAA